MNQSLRLYDRKRIHMDANELIYITADGNYATLHCHNKPSIFVAKTLKRWEEELPSFVRIHKNCLVNPRYIDVERLPHRKNPTLRLITGQVLVVSRRRLIVLANLVEQ